MELFVDLMLDLKKQQRLIHWYVKICFFHLFQRESHLDELLLLRFLLA